MKLPTSIAAILVGLGLRGSEAADVTLPDIFADHMVIQTDEPITLSGTVSPSTSKVELSLSGQTVTVTPGLFGDWTAQLAPVSEPGGSHTLTLSVDGTVERTLSATIST